MKKKNPADHRIFSTFIISVQIQILTFYCKCFYHILFNEDNILFIPDGPDPDLGFFLQ